MSDPQVDPQLDRLFGEACAPGVAEPVVSAISERLRAGIECSRPAPSAGGLALRLLLAMLLVTLAAAGMMGLAGMARMSVVQRLVVSLALAGGAGLLGVSLAWQALPGSLHRVSPWTALGVSLVAFLGAVALLFPMAEGNSMESGVKCTRGGGALAVPPAVLLWLLVRRGAPQMWTVVGATIGGTAGLVAVAILQFHCPQQDVIHLGLWHGCVAVLGAIAGFGVGSALRWRS